MRRVFVKLTAAPADHDAAFTPRTAVVALGAVLIAIGLALYLGRFLAQTSNASSVVELSLAGPARPEVLELTDPAAIANQPIANIGGAAPVATLQRRAESDTAAPAASTIQRVIGRNYLVVQSFFDGEESQAQATVEVLGRHGVLASVERNPLNWWRPGSRTIHSVITADGFTENFSATPEYRRLVDRILEVSRREFGVTLRKKLDPRPMQWGGVEER